jgi:sugar phosphate permease
LAYATYYLGRKGFSVSKKTMGAELEISPSTMGAIDTAYLTAYAIGQFGNGLLGDRIGARTLLTLGLLGSALSCAAFGASSAAVAFGVLFFLNGLFQATGWPGTTRAMAEWTTPRNRGTVMAFWSTCYQVGGIVANAVCGYLLVRFGWRSSFFGPALLLVLMSAGIFLFLRRGPNSAPSQADAGGRSLPPDAEERRAITSAQRAVFRSGLLWSYGVSYFFIKFIRYALLFWLPYYLATVLEYRADVAANVASAFEAGGVVGVIVIGALSDRLRAASRPLLSALALVGLAVALFAYTELAGRGVWSNVLGLALIGALLFGPDALLAGAAAQDAGGLRAAATATGMVNGLGSIGGMAEGFAVPALTSRHGWAALVPALSVLAVGAALALLPAMFGKKPAS